MIKRFIPFLMIFSLCLGAAAQNRIFVATDGSNNRDGSTWENAKESLHGALSGATAGTTIYMKCGTYSTAGVTIPAGVTVIGGFTTTSTGTDTTHRQYPGTHDTWETGGVTTILDAYHNNRMATVQGHLENCVIRNGYIVGNGAGVYIDGGTVSHCVIIRNRAESTPGDTTQGKGGGAYITNGGKLVNSVLSYNLAREGLAVSGNDGELINNTITNNNAITNCGLVTDVDNHVYTTVVIGTQCWMAENLRTTHYPDGSPIAASNLAFPGNNSMNVAKYGLLYHSSLLSYQLPQGICPNGWRMPTSDNFNVLVNYVNASPQYRTNGENNCIAKALASKEIWETSSNNAHPGRYPQGNNATGFNAIPAGNNISSSDYGSQSSSINYTAVIWSTTTGSYNYRAGYSTYSTSGYYTLMISYNDAAVSASASGFGATSNKASIRCLKDE